MQIENFKIFADLVETKSFSKAAKLNGITQSAVSQQARSMERQFKALLIDRSQKQFQLTREGQLTAAGTYKPFAVYITVAAIYFAMCFPLSQWSRSIERKLDVAR